MVFIVLLIAGCDPLSSDYFSALFRTANISPKRTCEHNPGLFSEGRFVEVYKFNEQDMSQLLQSISKVGAPDREILQYDGDKQIISWKQTPLEPADSARINIHSEILHQEFGCFNGLQVILMLSEDNNYFTYLEDKLGGYKLFIVNSARKELYLLSSYEQ
jgi:hypothetical protein